MELITGGAYQGKLRYAKELFPDIIWIDGSKCSEEELYSCKGIFHFHQYLARSMREGKNVADMAKRLISVNPNAVIVTDEVGYGIVPADPFERQYRETTGRVCTELAAYATRVHRVICGVGMVIKG